MLESGDICVEKLRVAVFNTQPPHLYFGGVERRILETAKRMQLTIATNVFSGMKAGFKEPAIVGGTAIIPCFSTDTLFPIDNWFFNHTVTAASRLIVADLFEAHAVSGYGFWRTLRRRNRRSPFIQTVHGVLADEYIQASSNSSLSLRDKLANLIMWRLSRLEADSARNADLVVTISRYSFRKLIQLYDVEKSRIRIVPNGVDTERFVPGRGGVNLKHQIGVENRPVVLFVGRLIPRKGLMYLAEAARVVAREFNEVAFLVVGSGPLKKRMLSYLKQVDLMDNFVFLGDVSEASLPSLYACSDIFVLPSIQEGQGIAFLEAQASGKPVVAFDVGGVGEALQDGKTGLLVKPGSQNLGEALLKLLSDATLREKMGLSGRDYVSNNLSWDVCAKRMIEVYREASSFV